MDDCGVEDSIMQGRTPPETVKGPGGFHPDRQGGAPQFLFSVRIEPRDRKYLDNSGLIFSLCGVPDVINQPRCKVLFAADEAEKPGTGEAVRKDVKIVGTNPRSHLESVKVVKNELKTDPKMSRKTCN